MMQLKNIELFVDRSLEIYSSDNCQTLLKTYDEYYQKMGCQLPWVGYFVVKENQIVGSCGFTGQPMEGKVEIAYWTFKEYEGQGVSTFSCKQLILIAKRFDPTLEILAKSAPEHNASTKILQRNGFTLTEVVQDEEIGDAWLWALNK